MREILSERLKKSDRAKWEKATKEMDPGGMEAPVKE